MKPNLAALCAAFIILLIVCPMEVHLHEKFRDNLLIAFYKAFFKGLLFPKRREHEESNTMWETISSFLLKIDMNAHRV